MFFVNISVCEIPAGKVRFRFLSGMMLGMSGVSYGGLAAFWSIHPRSLHDNVVFIEIQSV